MNNVKLLVQNALVLLQGMYPVKGDLQDRTAEACMNNATVLVQNAIVSLQGMFSTLQQLGEPVRSRTEATASGDRWIEDAWSRGKAVNTPHLPGHRDFADIVQQTYDNPYRCDT